MRAIRKRFTCLKCIPIYSTRRRKPATGDTECSVFRRRDGYFRTGTPLPQRERAAEGARKGGQTEAQGKEKDGPPEVNEELCPVREKRVARRRTLMPKRPFPDASAQNASARGNPQTDDMPPPVRRAAPSPAAARNTPPPRVSGAARRRGGLPFALRRKAPPPCRAYPP